MSDRTYNINISIAGAVVKIKTDFRPVESLYYEFRTESMHDFEVYINENDVFEESNNGTHKIVRIRTQNILSKISDELIEYDIMLMHGTTIAIDDLAFIFTAESGTGKTTHVKKWLYQLPQAFVVNGDKPFIKFPADGGQPLACGSPWAGKENMYTNTMVPLKSIILMERAESNHMERISFAQAFPGLLQQVYRPADEAKMRKTLQLMQRLGPAVTFWRFQCNNFKDDCFDVAYNALVKGQ